MSEGLVRGEDGLSRCAWGTSSPEYLRYHDEEWGRPVHGEAALYERFSLEAFQSGLSWLTILRKREAFRAAFAGFDPDVVAAFGPDDVARLLADAGIVRNRAKIAAAVANARATLALRETYQAGLDGLVWSFAPPPPPPSARRRPTSRRPAPSRWRWRRPSSGPGSSSSVRRPRTRRCRPAVSSTTISRAATCPDRSGQRPSKSGFRLARNASTAAVWSAVAPVSAISSASCARDSSSGCVAE